MVSVFLLCLAPRASWRDIRGSPLGLGYPAQVRALTQPGSFSRLLLQPPSKERILEKVIQGPSCRAPSLVIHPKQICSQRLSAASPAMLRLQEQGKKPSCRGAHGWDWHPEEYWVPCASGHPAPRPGWATPGVLPPVEAWTTTWWCKPTQNSMDGALVDVGHQAGFSSVLMVLSATCLFETALV